MEAKEEIAIQVVPATTRLEHQNLCAQYRLKPDDLMSLLVEKQEELDPKSHLAPLSFVLPNLNKLPHRFVD